MHALLTTDYHKRHRKGGRRPALSPGDQLFLALQYWREYRTMKHLAYDFGIGKSTVSETITRVENALMKAETFHLPGKKALISPENTGRTFVVDVTESPIARPKKTKAVVFGQEKAAHDKDLSKGRIVIENINARIKTFKIMSERYRNRRKRHTS